MDQDELYREAKKYYANILTPFSPLVTKKIEEVLALDVPVDVIAGSHGVIWRDDPTQIVHKYLEWADAYQENQITIVYDSMWDGTRRLAEAAAEGIRSVDESVLVKLFNSASRDKNDIVTEIFSSKAILFGSPTINRGILTSMAALIEEIKGLRFKGKKAAAFGCYGWSGESIEVINEGLREGGFEIVDEGLKVLWNPDEAGIQAAREFGGRIAEISRRKAAR